MKNKFYLFVMTILGMVSLAKAQTGNTGNDNGATFGNYGYSWANSAAAGGPVYEWIDISATGTQLTGLGDDNVVGPIPLGIDFKYYWNTYSSCHVGSNGYIMFDDNQLIAQSGSGMPQIPFAGDNKGNFIAPLLGDLTFVGAPDGHALKGAKVLYQTIADKFIITYDSVRFWNGNAVGGVEEASGNISFQIVLNGTDKTITINYKKISGTPFTSTGNNNWGTFGMENVTGQLGLRWRRNPNTPALLPNQTSYRITPPANPTYQFKDAKAKALFNSKNQGSSVFKDNPTYLQAYVQNAGTTKIKTPVTTRIFLFDEDENTVFNSTVIVDSMAVGETRLVTFPTAFTATTVQQLDAQLTLSYVGDQLPANNTQEVKLVVIDTSQGLVDLRFTKQIIGDQTDPSFSRKGGMVLDAPYYPFKLKKVSIDLIWPDTTLLAASTPAYKDSLSETFVEVYLGDGPGNSRGTLLDSFTVRKSVVGADYDTVGTRLNAGVAASYFLRFYHTLAVPYNWTDKPIYVGYNHLSTTGFIWNGPYAEINASRPSSNRSLEITGGVWGEDRGKDSTDLAVSLIGTITPENPNLVIRAGGQILANNAVVDMGLSEFGFAVDTIIKINNSGSDTLRISGTSVSGAGWVIATLPASKVQPGDSTTIKVRYNGSAVGTANGELFINCNDQDQALSVTKFTVKTDYVIAWSPSIPNVQSDSLNLIFNALLGNKALATESGDVYVHTGLITSGPTGTNWEYVQGTWGTAADSVKLIPLGGNRFQFKVKINEFYNLPTYVHAYRLGMVFRNADGSKVGKTRADGDFFVPVTFSENPNLIVSTGGQVLANNAVVDMGTSEFGFSVDTLIKINNAGVDTLRISGTTVSGTGWVITSLPAAKVRPGDSTTVKVQYNGLAAGTANGQISINCNDLDQAVSITKFTVKIDYAIAWTPAIPNVQTDSLNLIFNALLGNKALATESGDVFVHTGVITSGPTGTNWEYVQGTWGTAADSVKLIPLGGNRFQFKVKINEFYNLPASLAAYRLGMVFRNADGSKVGKTRADGDFFVPVTFTTAVQKQISEGEIALYPNPAQDELHLNIPAHLDGNISVKIMNTLGQVLYSGSSEQSKIISVSNLKSGIYVLEVKSKGFSANKLFLKN